MEYAGYDTKTHEEQQDDATIRTDCVVTFGHKYFPIGNHSTLGKVIGTIDYVAIRCRKDAVVVCYTAPHVQNMIEVDV